MVLVQTLTLILMELTLIQMDGPIHSGLMPREMNGMVMNIAQATSLQIGQRNGMVIFGDIMIKSIIPMMKIGMS